MQQRTHNKQRTRRKTNEYSLVVFACILLSLATLLSSCTSGGGGTGAATTAAQTSTSAATAAQEDATTAAAQEASGGGNKSLTEVGTPRNETLIVDMLAGRATTPDLFNFYVPGATSNNTLNPWLRQHLWEVNTITGEIYGELADGMPVALDDTYTKFEIKIRQGLKWTDGVDFTANDVVFTGNMLLENEGLTRHAQFAAMVSKIEAKDDYTVYLETINPEPKLETRLGVVVHSNFFMPIPKHIWEKEDPLTFKFSEPISVSAYKLKEFDPQGYWFLYEKRDDWQYSLEGQKIGEPGPKYILQRAYGEEEKRVMAAVSHDLDIIAGIGPESWELLQSKSDTITCWYDSFPYATFDDTCSRGILLNNDLAPYNDLNVRWALALTVDVLNSSLTGFNGMQRFGALQVPPTGLLMETYYKPMQSWLENEFALEDGYKPFDTSLPFKLVEELKKQGVEGLPETDEEIVNTFGIGWWKYDPDKATELLQKSGFTLKDGKWYLPDGKLWTMELKTIKEGEVQHIRTAFSAAEAWRKFGIDVNVIQEESAVFSTSQSTGDYQVIGAWPCCGCIADISTNIETWRSNYYVPNGEVANANVGRWRNEEATDIMTELLSMPVQDPELVPKTQELLKIFAAELPYMPMYGSTYFTPVDTYYWTGFPSNADPYTGPWSWWAQFKYIIPRMKPTGK